MNCHEEKFNFSQVLQEALMEKIGPDSEDKILTNPASHVYNKYNFMYNV